MAQPTPSVWTVPAVVPTLAVSDPEASLAWFGHLGFTPGSVVRAPDGSIVHADLVRGDACVMLGPAMDRQTGAPGLSVYVNLRDESVDAFYERIKERVQVTQPPETMFWGDRLLQVRHPDGYLFWFAEHVRDVSQAEMEQAVAQCMGQRSA
ncbi:MAG TPA: VOC family protein [Chloroflexota bacterium]|jgi:PhnB protein|nr:VOC family protein [Chloroflexota bacterium]